MKRVENLKIERRSLERRASRASRVKGNAATESTWSVYGAIARSRARARAQLRLVLCTARVIAHCFRDVRIAVATGRNTSDTLDSLATCPHPSEFANRTCRTRQNSRGNACRVGLNETKIHEREIFRNFVSLSPDGMTRKPPAILFVYIDVNDDKVASVLDSATTIKSLVRPSPRQEGEPVSRGRTRTLGERRPRRGRKSKFSGLRYRGGFASYFYIKLW